MRTAFRSGSQVERPVSLSTRRLSLACLHFGGLLPTAFAPVGLFLPHWLLALGSCRHGAPGFFGVLFSFSFDFVFGELKLYGLHTSRI